MTREAFAKYVKVVKRSLSEAAAHEAASTAGVPMDAAAQHGHHGRSGQPSLRLTNPGDDVPDTIPWCLASLVSLPSPLGPTPSVEADVTMWLCLSGSTLMDS